jgi:hypothetical protein
MGKETGEKIAGLMGDIADLLKTVYGEVPPTTIVNPRKKQIGNSIVGQHVKAEPLSMKPPQDGNWRGSEPGFGNEFFRAVNKREYTYVQGHLLNHHLFGPGQDFNLVPIHRKLNTQMSAECEEKVKQSVLSQNKVVSYDITVHFGTWSPQYTHISEENDLPTSIRLQAYEMERKKNTKGDDPADWKVTSKEIYDHELDNYRGPDETPGGAKRLKYVNLNSRAAEAEKAFQEVYGIGEIRAKELYNRPSRFTDLDDVIQELHLPDDCRQRWKQKDHPTVALTGNIEWE